MNRRNSRILWLLNHKTLMPYETGLLQQLGFEVFTPKVIPDTEEYRSCIVDFSFDAKLTIPKRCLERLNAFNFYEDFWPPDITAIVNRYFGTAMAVVHRQVLPEVVDKFEGNVVLRAFGLPAPALSYFRALEKLYGLELIAKIYGLGDRFWFGQGYEQLRECEPPLLARRAVFLPFGLPPSAWRNAQRWNGSLKKILFLCRWIVTNPYYAAMYEQFKRQFGDLPHVIVGAQDVPVPDASLAGYVSDEQLQQLYQDCAVFYYPSHEPRHVHYHPVEATVVGMPVVFYNESLLGRLLKRRIAGGVDTPEQARNAIERILGGDRALIDTIRREQHDIASWFSDATCRAAWNHTLSTHEVFPRPPREPWPKVWAREATRWLLQPLAKGRSRLSLRKPSLPPPEMLRDPLQAQLGRGSLVDGIDFRQEGYPSFVSLVGGMSHREPWGRWTVGRTVTFVFNEPIGGRFRLIVVAGAYEKNVGAAVKVRIGRAQRVLRFATAQDHPQPVTADFSLSVPSNVIELVVPYPTRPPSDDTRALGIAMVQLRVELLSV